MFKDPKFKNPYFWLGVISLVFATANIRIEDLTSWSLLFDAIKSISGNPAILFYITGALIGVWNDNSTPGMDKLKVKGK